MSILNSYSPVQYRNKLSQPEIASSQCNYFPYNTSEVTPHTTSDFNDYKAEDIKFYRKRDIEMAWPAIFQNANTTQNCVCSIVRETGSKNTPRHHSVNGALCNLCSCQCPHSKNPRTNTGVKNTSNFNLTSPRTSATVKPRTSRKGRNPYRRVPGKQNRVYLIQSSDATAECRNNSLYRAPILVNAYNVQTEIVVHNEKLRRNKAEELPGGAAELSAVHLCPNYEQNLIKDDIAAASTNFPQLTELRRDTSPGFRLKTSERTNSESKYLNLYPRCEFTIIEIEPNKR